MCYVLLLAPDVTWDEWSFYLLPLDDDIISMELPEFFRDYFLVSMDRFSFPFTPSLFMAT